MDEPKVCGKQTSLDGSKGRLIENGLRNERKQDGDVGKALHLLIQNRLTTSTENHFRICQVKTCIAAVEAHRGRCVKVCDPTPSCHIQRKLDDVLIFLEK